MIVSLPAITALARAGAVERAWSLFHASGFDTRSDDAAALAVKGRLLKSRARLAAGIIRLEGFAAAAGAYAAADRLAPAPYLAINAATSRLLAGDPAAAALQARAVLTVLDGPEPPADTPYYLAATRAEALLLAGDPAGAETAMAQAALVDPDGWADRAVTLAQLEEVGAALDCDLDWLERFRPPASLHFAGHIGIAAGGAAEASLVAQVDAVLAAERVGFGYGALAAGIDIVVAERLVAADAELHVVLPTSAERFEQQSVSPAGDAWVGRYWHLLERATSIKVVDDWQGSAHDRIATRLASELAVGATLLKAQSLDAHAVQLVVLDDAGGGFNTAEQARLWRASRGNPQHVLTLSRETQVSAQFPPEEPDPGRMVAALLAIRLDQPGHPGPASTSSQIAAQHAPVGQALAGIPPGQIRAGAGQWQVVLTDMAEAAAVISAVLAAAATTPISLAVHYAIVTCVRDGAAQTTVPYGAATAVPQRLLDATPPGLCMASEDFAVALTTFGIAGLRAELYHQGEPELGGAVYTLLRAV
ncbi:MAG TPA: hypothetical protein VHG29_10140 [Novosphingobium sp.]|nr:hypothetical protein [Novosphingobium sp.]